MKQMLIVDEAIKQQILAAKQPTMIMYNSLSKLVFVCYSF